MSKDKNAVVERLRARILPENQIFVRKNLAISEHVEALRKQKGWTEKELAQKLGKTESEVIKVFKAIQTTTDEYLDNPSKPEGIEIKIGQNTALNVEENNIRIRLKYSTGSNKK